MEKKNVVLDTSFLLVPFQLKLDIMLELDYLLEGEFSFIVPSGVVSELTNLSKNSGKEGAAARFALKVLDMNKSKITVVNSSGSVDDWIYHYCKESSSIACTVDRALAKKLKYADCRVIVVKGMSKLGFI